MPPDKRTWNWLRGRLLVGAAIALLLQGPVVIIHWASVYGPRWYAIPGVELLIFPTLFSILLILLLLPLLLVERIRRPMGSAIIVLLVLLISGLLVWPAAWTIRTRGFADLARGTRPLVQAIKAYEVQHGVPPPDLETLDTSLTAGLAPFDYVSGDEARARYHGNPWVLKLDTSIGLLNWDQFLYYPLQNYPKTGHGGWLQRIEDWAYVNE